MNAVSKLAIVLGLGATAAFSAQGASSEDRYLRTFHKRPDAPEPVMVVAPAIVSAPAGAEARIVFVVDQDGVPQDVTVAKATHEGLGTAAVEAVKQWRFNPVVRDGEAVSTKVVLPVRVSRDTGFGTTYAAR